MRALYRPALAVLALWALAAGCGGPKPEAEASTNTTSVSATSAVTSSAGGSTGVSNSNSTSTSSSTTGTAAAGAAGQAGAPATTIGNWSCGTAAGVCSCTLVSSEVESEPCAASDCCFVDSSGDCSCRVGDPAPDCEALRSSFGDAQSVPSCPAATAG